jgi:hypothetical protein
MGTIARAVLVSLKLIARTGWPRLEGIEVGTELPVPR